ncbi:uncharacterized protein B0I36DRAFT_336134 [Microdochium trichocladiopsis]|uniref:Uncharacterized protein n=1 Tax=Microdochium trichocladiopsis TaxID=1682393 RepID=A0A9P8XUU7_9PEZI|nr:uncharacterized protein B0I36DRAFT_336134 [Microdochium trichocladiopsis]KAH7018518.1 hypothetical protein B0I36DRAFT_336134 [Microdochium trichocladiopsis]
MSLRPLYVLCVTELASGWKKGGKRAARRGFTVGSLGECGRRCLCCGCDVREDVDDVDEWEREVLAEKTVLAEKVEKFEPSDADDSERSRSACSEEDGGRIAWCPALSEGTTLLAGRKKRWTCTEGVVVMISCHCLQTRWTEVRTSRMSHSKNRASRSSGVDKKASMAGVEDEDVGDGVGTGEVPMFILASNSSWRSAMLRAPSA